MLDGRARVFSRQGYADRLLWSVRRGAKHYTSFHGRSLPPGFGHLKINFKTLAAVLKNKSEPPPAASEYEAGCMLGKTLPIIPLYREELAPSCRGCCRLQRDHWEKGRERKQEGRNSKSGGQMTEVFMSAGLREYS